MYEEIKTAKIGVADRDELADDGGAMLRRKAKRERIAKRITASMARQRGHLREHDDEDVSVRRFKFESAADVTRKRRVSGVRQREVRSGWCVSGTVERRERGPAEHGSSAGYGSGLRHLAYKAAPGDWNQRAKV